VGRGELARELVHALTNEYLDALPDRRERGAKDLLLALERDRTAVFARDMIAALRDQLLRLDARFQHLQRLSHLRRVDVSLLTLQHGGFENGQGL
jgi:hypothetical protein